MVGENNSSGNDKQYKLRNNSWLAACCTTKCFLISSSSPSLPNDDSLEKQKEMILPTIIRSNSTKRKPGGWKAMPFVLGNETFERLASIGLLANFMVFLVSQYHLDQASAANFINIWNGISNFGPLIGAFVSDAYVGRFWTIGFASFFSLLGMMTLTLTAWIPHLHPPPCTKTQLQLNQKCTGPNQSQMGLLVLSLGLLSIGTSGIRPCSIPFGIDQFDPTTDDGRKGINSFFNWYYTSFTVVLILALTVVIYIQDQVGWVLGFGLLTICMMGSILLFFVGTKLYVYVKPEGSVFSGIAYAVVAAYKKRHVVMPSDDDEAGGGVFYDPMPKGTRIMKLPLTSKFRSLNKAAIILEGELNLNGTPTNPWRLCSIQTIEEVKCLLKVIPIWASGIVCFAAVTQQGTFTVSQALKMDRHLGPNFQIPPGSIITISMLTVGIWVPFYDRVLVPFLKKITKVESGITVLQRIGIGMIFSVLSMIVAGLVEEKRRASANAPLSVFWLAPQLCLMGFAEAFNIIGQIEFYNKEFPDNMSSLANSLFSVTMAGANYLSSLLIVIVRKATRRDSRPDWLTGNINEGRVDYFYYVIAGMGVFNFIYFISVASRYTYKASVGRYEEEKARVDVELNTIKK